MLLSISMTILFYIQGVRLRNFHVIMITILNPKYSQQQVLLIS